MNGYFDNIVNFEVGGSVYSSYFDFGCNVHGGRIILIPLESQLYIFEAASF